MLNSVLRPVLYRLLYQLLFFVAGLFVARLAGADMFGVISLMIVNAAVVTILTELGTGASVVWHGTGNEIQDRRLFSFAAASAGLQLCVFAILEFAWIMFSGRTLLMQQKFETSYLFDESIYFVGLVLAEKYTSLFYGRHAAALANATLSVVTGVFVIVFGLMYNGVIKSVDSLQVFCAMFLALGVAEALVFHFRVQGMSFLKPAREELRSLLSFSMIVFVTNIVQFFAYRIDFWLIDHFYSNTELGIYAQANRFAQVVWVLPVIIAALLPTFMRRHEQPLSTEGFLPLIRATNFIVAIAAISVMGVAAAMYKWFLQREYAAGFLPLLIMLPGYFLFSIATLLAAWFSAKRLLRVNFIGSAICFVLILTSDLILIPIYAMNGAAIANTIAYSLTTVYFIYQFNRHQAVKLKQLLFWRKNEIFAIKRVVSP